MIRPKGTQPSPRKRGRVSQPGLTPSKIASMVMPTWYLIVSVLALAVQVAMGLVYFTYMPVTFPRVLLVVGMDLWLGFVTALAFMLSAENSHLRTTYYMRTGERP